MKKHLLLFMLLLVAPFASKAQTFVQAYADIVNQCSQNNITSSLTQFEALGVKRRGTAALQNTLDWLKNKYLSYGYTANQLQEFSYTYSGSSAVCKNLVVTKIGTTYPNTFLIICGHYDSIVGTGTNDNGSGVAAILEVARLLRNVPTEYSIKFINFSGEEDGLRGSQNYVSTVVNGTTPKMNIRLVFNLDEIGGVAGLINDTITCERDTSTPTSNNAASNAFTNQLITCTELYSPLNTFLSYAYASDYMSFQANNEVITGFFETNETTHRHTATDFLVNMDPVYNFNVAKAATGAALHFAVASTSPLNTVEQNDNLVTIFPNPATDELYLNLGTLPQSNYTFSLLDINGKTVFTQFVENAPLVKGFSVGHLQRGMYLGIVESEGKRITKKIVLE
ncbi:M28 family peptidase [Flavobacterium sp.]|uniref:M28 family peptidase n=1 Tax=Flavobacterium sp. TaxID=239 RepID=UPI002628903B|nr:M28 family peptidase [Flavobacterium sp.]